MSEVSSEAVEAAAEALHDIDCGCKNGPDSAYRKQATAALTAALPYLVPEGTQPGCTGAPDCPAPAHVHGCYADAGHCDDPQDHESALSPRVVPSAEEVERVLGKAHSCTAEEASDGDVYIECACGEGFDSWNESDAHVARALLALFASEPTVAEVREQVAREIEKAGNAALNDAYEMGDQGKAIYSDGLLDAARIARGETKGGE